MSSFPPPVPKPATAGAPKVAIANTREAFANIRNGPSARHRDIGDLRDYTLVSRYPATRTADGWEFIEQYGTNGWIYTPIVEFEDVVASPPQPGQVATPYDGKIALWHWRGDSIAENTIDDVAKNIKAAAPYVNALFVKTSDFTPSTGAQWMGYWDSKRSLAIDGPASIDRWVTTLAKYGIDFHAWCVPRGIDPAAEANLIVQACLRPGVRSMILDVEPYEGFWSGGRAGIRPFMTRIRRSVPGAFHIGMTVDPRPRHYESIFPLEWFPFINSIHPQDYWATFQRDVDAVLEETFQLWGTYGRPIIPALQGDAIPNDMRVAHTLSTQRYKARGVSWWRLGVIGPNEFGAINQPITPGAPPPTTPPPNEQYVEEQIVRPLDSGFAIWSHTGQQETESFQSTWGWTVYYKQTEATTSKIAARWSPKLTASGKYEIAVFISARHSTTRNARYKIHGVKGAPTELVVVIDQAANRNAWVKLGVFDFDRATVNAGVVFLNDLTGEADKSIVFDAVRWRRLPPPEQPRNTSLADGFDSPVGTPEERRGGKVWPGSWVDASPFARLYFVGTPSEAYHTGADLNLPRDADAHAPIYACAQGVVTFAARLPTWGNVIIIRHDPLTVGGTVMYSRYGHVEEMVVKVGQKVKRGEPIAKVGNAFGRFAYHLHFDLSPTNILETKPQHWPGTDRATLLKHYVDPKIFIETNRPK